MIGLAWTSDGRDLVVASRRGSSIHSLWRIPITGGTLERLLTIGQNVVSPAISRQGDRLAYTQTLDDENIWRLALDATGRGGALTRLISSTLTDNGPDYSPDGQKIVFASNKHNCDGRKFELFMINADGTGLEQITDFGGFTSFADISPDGKKLVFVSDYNAKERYEFNIFTADWR